MTTIADIQQQVHDLKVAQGFQQTTLEQQLACLIAEVGEVAQKILALRGVEDTARRHDVSMRLGMELYDVIWNACACADLAGVDLERCIAEKVSINKTRTWRKEQPDDER